MSYIGRGLEYGQSETFIFTASGSETSVTTVDDGRTVSYNIGFVDVYLNGVRLISGSDYTATTGSSITGLAALAPSDVVEVVAHNVVSGVDSVSQQNGGSFYGPVTLTGPTNTIGGALTVTANTTFSGNTVTINGNLTVTGTTTTVDSATAQTIDLGDNDKMQFGDSNDLQIYHDASHSYITDAGTGNLKVAASQIDLLGGSDGAETMATFVDDGAVTLYYDNAAKIATTTGGIDVTGTTTTDLLATGNTTITGSLQVTGQAYGTVVTAADGATITPNFANGNMFSVTIAGNRTLANPTNAQPGQVGSIFVKQDGTGSRTLSFGVNWHFPAASAPTLTTTPNAVDRIDYVVYAANAVHAIATLDNRNS